MQERDRGYTPAWSIFCLFQIWAEADIQLCKIVLHAPGPGCSMEDIQILHRLDLQIVSYLLQFFY